MASLTEKLSDNFSSLPPRDRMIYIGLFGFGVFCFLCFGGYLMYQTIQEKKEDVKSLEQQVIQTTLNVAKIENLREDNKKYEQNFADNQEAFQSFLEGQLASLNLSNQLSRKGAPINRTKKPRLQSVEGNTYEVELLNIELENLSKFLYALETSTYPLEIIKMTITPKRRQKNLLNVNLDVSAYQLPSNLEETNE